MDGHVINHAGGVETRYAHLQANSIPAGAVTGAKLSKASKLESSETQEMLAARGVGQRTCCIVIATRQLLTTDGYNPHSFALPSMELGQVSCGRTTHISATEESQR